MPPSLADLIATRAEFIVNSYVETRYIHHQNIDPQAGVYDCDCSEFVSFVLEQIAPDQYAAIASSTDSPRPLAFDYYTFLSNLTSNPTNGWSRVNALRDARRGDVVAWRTPEIEPKHDTGHCFFVAEAPLAPASEGIPVRVYDSAAKPHFEDTRLEGQTGVGSGFINFKVDGQGAPIAFQFGPAQDVNSFVFWQIAIGRAQTAPEA